MAHTAEDCFKYVLGYVNVCVGGGRVPEKNRRVTAYVCKPMFAMSNVGLTAAKE